MLAISERTCLSSHLSRALVELVEVVRMSCGFFRSNRPFPSSRKSHFQSEAKCEAIDMKMIFNYYANISHFHNKGFALSLVLKLRFFGTRKWPIVKRRKD